MNQSILPASSLYTSSARGPRRGAILLTRPVCGRSCRLGVGKPQIRERLVEPAPRLVVDLSLEERHDRGHRVDREPGLVEVALAELPEGERRQRRGRREQELP